MACALPKGVTSLVFGISDFTPEMFTKFCFVCIQWFGCKIVISAELAVKNNGSFGRLTLGTTPFVNWAVKVVLVVNFALLILNLISSNWSGSHILMFCDLYNDPAYGCLSINWLVSTSTWFNLDTQTL